MANSLVQKIKELPIFKQIGKFLVTGFINTGVDFAILSLLIFITGINEGAAIFLFATISFTVAATNSFFLNRYWTFAQKGKKNAANVQDFAKFLIVTIVGWLINAGITYLVSNIVPPFFGLLPESFNPDQAQSFWVLASKALATGLSLVWNFVGYKFFVFKNKK